MTIRTLLAHFTHRVLMNKIGQIVIVSEDNTEEYRAVTTEEGYRELLEDKTRVRDWNLTTISLYIYI